MTSVTVCTFLVLLGLLRAYELSPTMVEYYCVMNGRFSDKAQVNSDDSNHTFLTFKVVPIYAPAVSQIPILYVEHVENGVVARSKVQVVTEGADGIVYEQPYNISGNNVVKPDTFDPQVLKTITRDQLQGEAGCKATYKRIAPLIFIMRFPDCKLTAVHGLRETYDGTFSCNTATVIAPVGAAENPTLTPYEMDSLGEKYPLENSPSNYVCNCSTTGN